MASEPDTLAQELEAENCANDPIDEPLEIVTVDEFPDKDPDDDGC